MEQECEGCGKIFLPRCNVPNQHYCCDASCQRLRRRRWQKKKMHSDEDYRENQRQAQEQWRRRNREYMQNYRQNHPEYCQREAQNRRCRHKRRRTGAVKMDEYKDVVTCTKTGVYRLCEYGGDDAVKMDEWCRGKKVQVIVLEEETAVDAKVGEAP